MNTRATASDVSSCDDAGRAVQLPELLGGAFPALVGGIGWALVPLVRGAAMIDVALLVATGALTQWLTLLAWSALERNPAQRANLALTTALLIMVAAFVGQFLLSGTHHRPLGAVTWVVLLLGTALGATAVSARLAVKPPIGGAFVVLCLAFALTRSLPALTVGTAAEVLVGVVAVVAVVQLQGRLPAAWLRVAWLPAALIVAVSVYTVLSGAAERLHEQAPIVAGLIGALH
jgi:hypothetical protein